MRYNGLSQMTKTRPQRPIVGIEEQIKIMYSAFHRYLRAQFTCGAILRRINYGRIN